jgi:hypothetical protein
VTIDLYHEIATNPSLFHCWQRWMECRADDFRAQDTEMAWYDTLADMDLDAPQEFQ